MNMNEPTPPSPAPGMGEQPPDMAEQAPGMGEQPPGTGEQAPGMAERALGAAFSSPTSQADLLREVVVAAMGVVESQAGALFLLDETRGDLPCRVSIGGSGDALLGVRVPVGTGIVGHVVATEDFLIANDPSGAFEDTPWKPRNLLCVPVLDGERLVGALELCDRTRDGLAATYSFADARTLGHFAPVAARAISLSGNVERGLEAASQPAPGESSSSEDPAGAPTALRLARLVRELVAQGEAEAQTCCRLLETFLLYVRPK